MYPQWLLDGMQEPEGGVDELLRAAQDLVPLPLIEERQAAEELRECAADRHYHFWLGELCELGRFAEATERDEQLPPEFWYLLASVAHGLGYPQMVPYCLGKAKRLPPQDPADLIAAFVLLPNVLGARWRAAPRLLRKCRKTAEKALRSDGPAAGAAIDAGDLGGLAGHLRAGAYDRAGERLSTAFSESFDDLFALVTARDFPAEHAAYGWAVIGTNPFEVVLSGGGSAWLPTPRSGGAPADRYPRAAPPPTNGGRRPAGSVVSS